MLIAHEGVGGSSNRLQPLAPLREPQRPAAFSPAPQGTCSWREPSYHPQLAQLSPVRLFAQTPPATPAPVNPYALPAGTTLKDVASGTAAQPFDVTLSQLATASYGTRGDPPEGWSPVSDALLESRGVTDPTAWRQTFLGGGEQTMAQQFKAEIYSDGTGNFVLSYRGTAEGKADWENNFTQGTGFETGPVDKFTGTAVATAVEFAVLFGDARNGAATNLAITGHSQGGGLASVGSLASGVPAVTFDASGIHPNTLDRMGLAPQQARDAAEGGQIRAYSLKSDLLTRVQEGSLIGLAAPDALGTSIVVEPKGGDGSTLFGRGAEYELGLSGFGKGAANTVVELARNSGIPIIKDVGQLAYNAVSHSPNLLTDTMIDQQPWQPGYQNPSDLAKTLHDLVPEGLRDDFARNTHELADEITGVIKTDMKAGDYLQGSWRIAGHLADGVLNSTGDTIHHTAEGLAQRVDNRIPGPVGDVLSGAISNVGKFAQTTVDKAGDRVEQLASAQGAVAQNTFDGAVWLGTKTAEGIQLVDRKVAEGSQWLVEKSVEGATWVGGKAVEGGAWLADKAVDGARWAGDKAVAGATTIKDAAVNTGRAIADTVTNSRAMPWNW